MTILTKVNSLWSGELTVMSERIIFPPQASASMQVLTRQLNIKYNLLFVFFSMCFQLQELKKEC